MMTNSRNAPAVNNGCQPCLNVLNISKPDMDDYTLNLKCFFTLIYLLDHPHGRQSEDW